MNRRYSSISNPFYKNEFCYKYIEYGVTKFRNKIAHYERINNIEKYLVLEKNFITLIK